MYAGGGKKNPGEAFGKLGDVKRGIVTTLFTLHLKHFMLDIGCWVLDARWKRSGLLIQHLATRIQSVDYWAAAAVGESLTILVGRKTDQPPEGVDKKRRFFRDSRISPRLCLPTAGAVDAT